ncbi:hypothetical protein [Paenibacillus sp. B01]|uniref:hypothetical protein n=1 Tax=Paenibacillus sp. B01 TaxID=2660554 RepID=UPI00129A93E9|nr:hypothetical protein [Paenibacillus sp. B01]QGG54997.1 hypothetical protein GE073_04965 [Paenibacillus sp. B01]
MKTKINDIEPEMRKLLAGLLVVLALFASVIGYIVFDRLDAELFSHGAVPVPYSLGFTFLLAGFRFVLGYLIRKSTPAANIIIAWPIVHLGVLFISLLIGQFLEIVLVVVFYTLVVLPINLIGESISLGFQLNKWFVSSTEEKMLLIGFSLLNLAVIIYVIHEISNEYLAKLF